MCFIKEEQAVIHDHIICQFMFLQSLMVAKAKEELEQEILVKEEEKHKYLAERAPPLNTSGLSLAQLQVTFFQIFQISRSILLFPPVTFQNFKTSKSCKRRYIKPATQLL